MLIISYVLIILYLRFRSRLSQIVGTVTLTNPSQFFA